MNVLSLYTLMYVTILKLFTFFFFNFNFFEKTLLTISNFSSLLQLSTQILKKCQFRVSIFSFFSILTLC